MLRHIIALSILLLSLLGAGVPAFACGGVVPAQGCCPNGPIAPCEPSQSQTSEANRLTLCCAAGGAVTPAAAVAGSSKQFLEHWDRAHLPVLFVALTMLSSAYADAPSVDEFSLVSPPSSDSTLYLSTGRLRL